MTKGFANRNSRSALFVVAAAVAMLLASAPAALGQGRTPANRDMPTPAPMPAPTPTIVEIQTPSDAKPQPVDPDDVAKIARDHSPIPITPARHSFKVPPPKPELPEEGSAVINARCSLVRDEQTDWSLVVFDADQGVTGGLRRYILPGPMLESMEKHLKDHPAAHFRISGENFVYHNVAFLSLQKAVVEVDDRPLIVKGTTMPAISTTAPVIASELAPASGPSATEPATQPQPAPKAEPKPEAKSAVTGDADEIAEQLLKTQPAKPIFSPVELPKPAAVASVAPVGGEELSVKAGDMLVDRVVRFEQVPGSRWWVATFESDNTLQEPPMRLLPCKLLEDTEKILPRSDDPKKRITPARPRAAVIPAMEAKTPRYRISGEVTQYDGKRFILIRKVVIERDMGQF